MSVQRLQLFKSIADLLSITEVAQRNHVTQSAVSQQLRRLQEEFGVLVKKNGRRIELTALGHAFRKDAERALAELEGLNRKYTVENLSALGAFLTIGGSYGPSTFLLPSVLVRFKKKRPQVDPVLLTATGPTIQNLVLTGKIDVALLSNPVSMPGLQLEPYRQEQLALFVPPDHHLAKKRRAMELSELVKFPFVVRTGVDGQSRSEKFFIALGAKGIEPKVAMRCATPAAVKTAVKKRAGVGILYKSVIEEEVRKGEFKVLKVNGIDLSAWSYIVSSKDRPLSPIAQDFLTFLRAAKR